ncbi:unnamed protein product, partial [marine sediment metagenome]
LIDAFNCYFFDWGLSLSALFHDCSYPLASKLVDKFCTKIRISLEEYSKTFRGILKWNFPKSPPPIKMVEDIFKTEEFKEFSELLQNFYFCVIPKYTITPKDIKNRMKHLEHDILSAFFVYLIKDKLLKLQLDKEEIAFKNNINLTPIVKDHLIGDLKNFYLDAAIHAIAFHHTSKEILWEWNPILYLLRIADVTCSFARPEIEELRGRTIKLEGIKLGVEGTEPSNLNSKGSIEIFIGFDYRNKFLSKKKDKKGEHNILKKIWNRDLKNQIPNLENLSWLKIETQLLGKFGFK